MLFDWKALQTTLSNPKIDFWVSGKHVLMRGYMYTNTENPQTFPNVKFVEFLNYVPTN